MGLFSGLFKKNKGETRKSAALDTSGVTPDKPLPIGFKASWLCIKSKSSEDVVTKLNGLEPAACNWEDGLIKASESGFFVSPVVNGWVLVVGFPTFGWSETEVEVDALRDIASRFPEVQAYVSDRIVDLCGWAKFVGGELKRGYVWLGEAGEVQLNEGELTPEEQTLGFDKFINDNTADDEEWENTEFPDEMSVCDIAEVWGVDPLFKDDIYKPGVGFYCKGTDY